MQSDFDALESALRIANNIMQSHPRWLAVPELGRMAYGVGNALALITSGDLQPTAVEELN